MWPSTSIDSPPTTTSMTRSFDWCKRRPGILRRMPWIAVRSTITLRRTRTPTSTHCPRTTVQDVTAMGIMLKIARRHQAKRKGKASKRLPGRKRRYHPAKAVRFCSYCKRPNHTKEKFWGLHLELKHKSLGKGKSRRVVGLDEDAEADGVDDLGFLEIGAIDMCTPCGGHDVSVLCCDKGKCSRISAMNGSVNLAVCHAGSGVNTADYSVSEETTNKLKPTYSEIAKNSKNLATIAKSTSKKTRDSSRIRAVSKLSRRSRLAY